MTVENLVMTGVWTPGARNTSAHVKCEMSWVTCSKTLAVLTLAWVAKQVAKGAAVSIGNHKTLARMIGRYAHLKETLGCSTTSVYHTLRNALPVKLCKLLNQVVILQKHWACRTASEG